MSGNDAFELIQQQGWQTGLRNMLRAELKRWWKTRTWWVQSLIWIGLVDMLLLMILFAANSADEAAIPPDEIVMLYGIFGGMFTTIGVVIMMQGAIVGEKLSGTAAWILSKPISRPAFVISKLLASGFGVAVTAVLLPGIGAYLVISIGTGETLGVLDFIAGLGILLLYTFYWLVFTLMLGTFFSSRGPVIGIPLAFVLGQQFILGLVASISPLIPNYLPFLLVMPPQSAGASSVVGSVILGNPPPSWTPIISSLIGIILFITVAIWRFQREEL